ncbi:hypothetical protein BpHYR1_006084 [Brachionus plicatilis]|uniref:Uncharacterized protein n=1 Tax=Brachionus plicatilis TaxID=10195 RepID=A0A3M7RD04_BRAPC|nr:hypothetical protein BpHYR1_006084 [Brachionus plicatilis]
MVDGKNLKVSVKQIIFQCMGTLKYIFFASENCILLTETTKRYFFPSEKSSNEKRNNERHTIALISFDNLKYLKNSVYFNTFRYMLRISILKPSGLKKNLETLFSSMSLQNINQNA